MNERHDLANLVETLQSRGDQEAIVEMRDDDVLSLGSASLASRIEKIATGATAQGLGNEDRIALFASPGAEWIKLFLGFLRAGVTVIPLDTQLEPDELDKILADADIRHVVADAERQIVLDDIGYRGTTAGLHDDGEADSWESWLDNGGDLPDPPAPDQVAVILYTSGTTGPPKGVPLTHAHIACQVEAVEDASLLVGNDRMLQPLPLHHVYPLVIGTLVPLALGVTIVLPSSLTGPELIRAIREQDVTIILGVPRLYSALLAGLERQIDEIPVPFRMLTKALIRVCSTLRAASGINAGRLLLRPLHKRIGPRLRVLASGGSPLDPAVARRLEGVGWNVAIGYGLTETSPLLTIRPPGKGTDDTVGRAVRGAELRVDQSVETTGDDDDGEILARGPGVFDGYLNRDDETEASFTDDGWFRTGDLGRLDSDGQLYVLGRKSTMLVSASGENIRTEALEETYAEHPHIGEVGILKDGDRLAAVIYPDPETLGEDSGSAEDAIADAVAECSGKLPSHQRLDRFRITHEPLDRTRLDKIRRQKLEERYESLESESSEHEPEPMAIDEMSPGDRKLLADERTRQVWELMVRRYPGVRLTPDTNFRLALGVDSLGWLDLSTEILRETGIELREDDISKIDTLRDLLEAIADRESAPDNLKAPLEDPDAALSEAQKAWLKPRPRIATATARGLYWLNSLLMRAGFRVRIEGQLPDDDTPLLIAPNHTSFLDPFVLAAALPAHLRTNVFWGGWTGWAYRNPIFRFFSRIARVIPVERERRVVSSLTFAKAALDRNRILVWFPEGERSRDGDLKPLRPGIGALLEHSPDVCVVPVWIAGAFEAWPYGKRMPRLRRISIHFGSGTSPAQLEQAGDGDDSRERLLEGLRSRIRALRPED